VGTSDPKVPSLYRLESTTFSTARNHPYAVKVQDGSAPTGSRTVFAASTGSKYTQFQLLDAGPNNGFYLYNPESQTFLAQAAQGAAIRDDVGAESVATFVSMSGEGVHRFVWQFFLNEDVPDHGKSIVLPLNYSDPSIQRVLPLLLSLSSGYFNARQFTDHYVILHFPVITLN
jgi:hypothetical protein